MVDIMIYFRAGAGELTLDDQAYSSDEFAGMVPSIGDRILYPMVEKGADRRMRGNRQMLEVVGRVFNPRDRETYVALIVEERPVPDTEVGLLPNA